MPVFWPWTQWYYSSIGIPGVSEGRSAAGSVSMTVTLAAAAAVLASPVEGAPVVALLIVAIGPPLAAAIGRRRATQATEPSGTAATDPPIAGLP